MLVDFVGLGSLVALWPSPKNYFLSVSKGDLFQVTYIKFHFKNHIKVQIPAMISPKEKSLLKLLLKASEDKRCPLSCFWSHGLEHVHILHSHPPRTDGGWTTLYCVLNYKMEKCFKNHSARRIADSLSFWTRCQHTAVQLCNASSF